MGLVFKDPVSWGGRNVVDHKRTHTTANGYLQRKTQSMLEPSSHAAESLLPAFYPPTWILSIFSEISVWGHIFFPSPFSRHSTLHQQWESLSLISFLPPGSSQARPYRVQEDRAVPAVCSRIITAWQIIQLQKCLLNQAVHSSPVSLLGRCSVRVSRSREG